MSSNISIYFSLTVKIINSLGLHARTSAILSHRANQYVNDITLMNMSGEEKEIVNCKSMNGLLSMAAYFGQIIKILVRGWDAEHVAYELKKVFENDFFETDCPNQLREWVIRYKEKDPIRLAYLYLMADPQEGKSNDLYYWSRAKKSTYSPLMIADRLVKVLDETFLIPNDPSRWAPSRLEIRDIDILHSKSGKTLFLESEDYTLLKYGRNDKEIFRNKIIEIVKGYINE